MVKRCCVFTCDTGSESCTDKNLSVFKVPSNAEIAKKWQKKLESVGRGIHINNFVCEKHFANDQVQCKLEIKDKSGDVTFKKQYKQKRLKKDAIPSLLNFNRKTGKWLPLKEYCSSRKVELKTIPEVTESLQNNLPYLDPIKLEDVTEEYCSSQKVELKTIPEVTESLQNNLPYLDPIKLEDVEEDYCSSRKIELKTIPEVIESLQNNLPYTDVIKLEDVEEEYCSSRKVELKTIPEITESLQNNLPYSDPIKLEDVEEEYCSSQKVELKTISEVTESLQNNLPYSDPIKLEDVEEESCSSRKLELKTIPEVTESLQNNLPYSDLIKLEDVEEESYSSRQVELKTIPEVTESLQNNLPYSDPIKLEDIEEEYCSCRQEVELKTIPEITEQNNLPYSYSIKLEDVEEEYCSSRQVELKTIPEVTESLQNNLSYSDPLMLEDVAPLNETVQEQIVQQNTLIPDLFNALHTGQLSAKMPNSSWGLHIQSEPIKYIMFSQSVKIEKHFDLPQIVKKVVIYENCCVTVWLLDKKVEIEDVSRKVNFVEELERSLLTVNEMIICAGGPSISSYSNICEKCCEKDYIFKKWRHVSCSVYLQEGLRCSNCTALENMHNAIKNHQKPDGTLSPVAKRAKYMQSETNKPTDVKFKTVKDMWKCTIDEQAGSGLCVKIKRIIQDEE